MNTNTISEKRDVIVNNGNVVKSTLDVSDIVFYDVRLEPFALYNFYDPINQPVFRRIPEEVARATSKGVTLHHIMTTGGRVRFSTDSEYIAIKTEQYQANSSLLPSPIATAGFDLYEDTDAGSSFIRPFLPKNFSDGYELALCVGLGYADENPEAKPRDMGKVAFVE